MDLSGNSGCSMQSSSGGDDEFDDSYNSIRGEGDHHHQSPMSNSFFNSINSPNVVGSISTPPQQPPPHFLSQQKYFDPPPLHHPSFPQANDLIWSRTSSSCNDDHQQNFTGDFGNLTASKNPSLADPSPSGHASKSSLGPDRLSGVIKNPKKRSRASRRAPTTVLATDTANFRQMVQEFTGIPDAPFRGSGGTSPYSRRLDLFSAAATALRSGAGAHFNPLDPLYPLRPSANKSLSPSSLLNSTTMIDSIVPTTTAVGASASNNSSNYQLPSVNNILNLQQQQQQQHHNINPLHISSMSLGNLSGFPSQQETQSRVVGDNNDRWTSGETVRNDDGVDENLVTSNFDANNNNNNINSNDSQRIISGYNLNVSEKGLENTVSNWGSGK